MIQRFGSAANLNIHLHALLLDGVYRCGAEGVPEFVEVGSPTDDEVHALLQSVITRLMKMLRPEQDLRLRLPAATGRGRVCRSGGALVTGPAIGLLLPCHVTAIEEANGPILAGLLGLIAILQLTDDADLAAAGLGCASVWPVGAAGR